MDFTKLFKRKLTPVLDKDIERYKDKQLKNIENKLKLEESDFKKIMKHITNKDIFNDECVIWKGVYCNKENTNKGVYINFYFLKKKHSLHRLIYQNFINSKLTNKMYLRHTCNNPLCLCVNHIVEKVKKDVPKDEFFKIELSITF